MTKITIATAKGKDPVLACKGCKQHEETLNGFEKKLSSDDYITGPAISGKEIEHYQKTIKPLSSFIEKCQGAFPKLFQYMLNMITLTSEVKGASCMDCKKTFDFFKYENLIMGFSD